MTEQQERKVRHRIKEIVRMWVDLLFNHDTCTPKAATSATEARAELRHLYRVISDHASCNYYDTHRQLVRDIAGR